MAVARAVANGNWSSTSTWNGGVLPSNGDTVIANGFNVTIDQDIAIGGANNPSVNAGSFISGQWYEITFVGTTSWTSIGASSNAIGIVFQATGNGGATTGVAKARATITTTGFSPAASGGGFIIATTREFSCDVRAGITACLTVTGTTDITWTSQNIVAGLTSGAHGILNNATSGTISFSGVVFQGSGNSSAFNNASTGTLLITNGTISGGGTNNGVAISNSSTGTVTINSATINGGSNGGTSAINNNASGAIIITGATITGGTGGSGQYAVINAAGGSIAIISSTLTAGSATTAQAAVINNSTGTVSITLSTFNASVISPAFSGSSISANVTLQGSQYDNANGVVAISCIKYKIGTTPTLMRYRKALDGTSTFLTLYTADFGVFGNPPIDDVRSGVNYGGGGLTGTAAIPAAGSVALGVPVDATTGTAVLTIENVRSAVLPLL
jgi:hypothetical protein